MSDDMLIANTPEMSDDVQTDLTSSTFSGTTHVDEEAQQLAQWAIPEEEANDGSQEPFQQQAFQQQAEDGEMQNLPQYLWCCHNMNHAAQRLTVGSFYSQDVTPEPEGKFYPKRIVSSPDFMDKQMEVWNVVLADDNSALLHNMYPSMEQVHDEYFSMESINGRQTLCVFERLGVSKAVMTLVGGVLDDEALSTAVGLGGDITYGPLEPADISSVEDDVSGFEPHGNFCVYSSTDCGRPFPVVGIEYRPSEMLLLREITRALAGEIVPERDVIGKELEACFILSGSKQLVTTTITHLFHRMVKCGVPYGYIYAGEAIIFVEIHEDPSIAHYYVSIPGNDVSNEDGSTLRYSAVGQIFAFIIRAMRAGPLSAQWHDKAASLGIWGGSCSAALLNMPSSLSAPDSSRATSCGDEVMSDVDAEYQHIGAVDNENTGINNGGGDNDNENEEAEDYDIEDDMYVYINVNLEPCQDGHLVPMIEDGLQYACQHGEEGFVDDGERSFWVHNDQLLVSDIRQRQYCTQDCLLGLSNGTALDHGCPNVDKHGDEHLDNMEFLRLVQNHLARTRHVSGCCVSLERKGSLGTMFKVMIPSHGYTFVAKGVTEDNVSRLLREGDTYTRLSHLQGGCVPVYLGIIQLEATFEHENTAYSHFMLLSWGGRPVENLPPLEAISGIVSSTRRAYMELHNEGLVHNDAELRNMLYNPQLDRIMLVDFERASIYDCHIAEFEYRNTSGSRHATIEEVEDEDAGSSNSGSGHDKSGDGHNHVHNRIPGHSHGGGLRRVNRCENLRREFEAASERELGHAVNLVTNLAMGLHPWQIRQDVF